MGLLWVGAQGVTVSCLVFLSTVFEGLCRGFRRGAFWGTFGAHVLRCKHCNCSNKNIQQSIGYHDTDPGNYFGKVSS